MRKVELKRGGGRKQEVRNPEGGQVKLRKEIKALSKLSAHLLPLEHVVVEVLLQLLVGEVDAELLEVVRLEGLEPWQGEDDKG